MLYVPECPKNLISESRLDKAGCKITKDDGVVECFHKRSQKIIAAGKLQGGLYHYVPVEPNVAVAVGVAVGVAGKQESSIFKAVAENVALCTDTAGIASKESSFTSIQESSFALHNSAAAVNLVNVVTLLNDGVGPGFKEKLLHAHCCSGHIKFKRLRIMLDLPPAKKGEDPVCEDCAAVTMITQPLPKTARRRAEVPLLRMHLDLIIMAAPVQCSWSTTILGSHFANL